MHTCNDVSLVCVRAGVGGVCVCVCVHVHLVGGGGGGGEMSVSLCLCKGSYEMGQHK